MKFKLIFLILLFYTLPGKTQLLRQLAPMPEPVSNNAVTGAMVGDDFHLFSFSGIDSTKKWSGIHKKAFRYNSETDIWDTIAPLPSGTGRIAAGASTVKNKIYIIGGYEVFSNGNERSLNEVHIYEPKSNTYLPNGKPIPVPIDDHVQKVWKDSLIFVVTGWSQNTNVSNVQIYNPTSDTWLSGTPVPNSGNYKVFGGSGAILGDTLYYAGGARIGTNFPPTNYLRKGYINPNNPTEITWSAAPDSESIIYRGACATNRWSGVVWFGGSETTYNYDGIAYNNSGGVEPSSKMKSYAPRSGSMIENGWVTFPKRMDFRGLAENYNEYYFAGGMSENQKVTNEVFSIYMSLTSTEEESTSRLKLYPNPTAEKVNIELPGKFDVTLFNNFGQKLIEDSAVNNYNSSIDNFPEGIYYLKIRTDSGFYKIEKIIKTKSF